jgi:heat shock protein HtpX
MIPTASPNAFATGRSPQHAAVAVTEGILRLMDREELEGVLAHELGHVRNRDTLISTIAATLAGVIMMLAHMARWAAFLGGGRDQENRGGLLGLVVMAVLAPLAAFLIQMAISRAREYLADATAAQITKKPRALASALQRLQQATQRAPLEANPATAHLFIVNPLSGRSFLGLFSTHPPIEERVARLLAMRA